MFKVRPDQRELFSWTKNNNTSADPSSPFYSYHRIEGVMRPPVFRENLPASWAPVPVKLAVDLDFVSQSWRMLSNTSHTETKITDMVLVKNGTWSDGSSGNHTHFPELDLHIPNTGFYKKSCLFRPFMKVYRTAGLSDKEIEEIEKREWSSRSEDNVVMRTASFGHGIGKLEVCALRNERRNGKHGVPIKGLQEDVMIPLGYLMTLRIEIDRNSNCSWRTTGRRR